MIGSPTLQALIAIVFVLVGFSSIVSLIVEYINNLGVRQKRQMYLYLSIRKALNDKSGLSWGALLYKHPLIRSVQSEAKRYPAYLAASTFTDALLAVIKEQYELSRITWISGELSEKTPDTSEPTSEYSYIKRCVDTLPESEFKRLMDSFVVVTGEDDSAKLSSLKSNIKIWFDNFQDRVIGDYKLSIRKDLRWVGIALAVILNVNLISIAKKIVTSSDLRNSLVSQAERVVRDSLLTKPARFDCTDCSADEVTEKYDQFVGRGLARADSIAGMLSTAGLPIGWEVPRSAKQIRIEYLTNEIGFLQKKKVDTIKHLLGKYCLVQAMLDPNGTAISWLHAYDTTLISGELIRKPLLDTLFKKKTGVDTAKLAKDLRFFFSTINDSITFGRCLPDPIKAAYDNCLTECANIDRKMFEINVIRKIDEQIDGNHREIAMYSAQFFDDGWSFGDLFLGPIRFLKYNFNGGGDVLIFLLGTCLMGILGAVGSDTWFQLLLKLFHIRNAGVRPEKSPKKPK